MEAYLRGLMHKQSIAYFPIGRAMCLPTDDKGGEVLSEVENKVVNVERELRTLKVWPSLLPPPLGFEFYAQEPDALKLCT